MWRRFEALLESVFETPLPPALSKQATVGVLLKRRLIRHPGKLASDKRNQASFLLTAPKLDRSISLKRRGKGPVRSQKSSAQVRQKCIIPKVFRPPRDEVHVEWVEERNVGRTNSGGMAYLEDIVYSSPSSVDEWMCEGTVTFTICEFCSPREALAGKKLERLRREETKRTVCF